ncbi:MAG: hypothetical protein ACPMAQ_04115, partial [Phycisphaerae bacterium]
GGTNVFVDLGSGNKGLRMKNNVNSLDEYLRTHTAGVTEVTFAARFRVDAYDPGFKGTLMYSNLDTGAGSPIPGICIIGDHFWLVNCFDAGSEVQLFDIGAVGTLPTAFHEAFVYYNNTENRVALWWDGAQVYNAIVGSAKPGQARFRFGALCMRPVNWPKNLTSTVTFDWVGYDEGPGANPPPGAWRTQPISAGGLLACYLDGSYYPDQFVRTNIMSRWNPDTALVTDALYDSPFYPGQTGILDHTVWHANGNDPSTSNVPSGGNYWVSALAVNPANGAAWMSWGAEATYRYAGTYGPTGAVYAMGKDDSGPGWSEGVPQAARPDTADNNSQVVALASSVKWMYALTCDLVTGEYNLFKTPTGVCHVPPQDADGDGDVDLGDFNAFQACFNGPNRPWKSGVPAEVCACQDSNDDTDVDLADFGVFQSCFNGPNRSPKCLP